MNLKGMIKELQEQVEAVWFEFSSIPVPSNLTDTQQSALLSQIKRTMTNLAELKGNIIAFQGGEEV